MIAGLILLGGGVAAGVFGSLLGLGGGILIVPLLTLGFGVPLREAVAASLVSVIVTSSASGAVYLQRHVANLRLGMTLELFSAAGALAGGLVAFLVSERVIAGLFAALMTWVAISMLRRRDPAPTPVAPAVPGDATGQAPGAPPPEPGPAGHASGGGASATGTRPEPDPGPEPVGDPITEASPIATRDASLRLPPPDPTAHRLRAADGPVATAGPVPSSFAMAISGPGYTVQRLPLGMLGSVAAGLNSALLGVGGGIVKVPLMHLVMGVPLRTSTATSNLMMGITAVSSAVIYLLRDEIDPFVAGPVALGVFVGASLGSRLAHRVDLRVLRLLFVVVLAYTAVQMAMRALGL